MVITLSMGVAVVDGGMETQVQDILRQADLGLYQAKKQGATGLDRWILRNT